MIIKETLCASDYDVMIQKKSIIDPTKTLEKLDHSLCPYCKKEHKTFKHAETVECSCGLKMTKYGNSLDCELDKKKIRFKKIKRVLNGKN